MLLGIWFPSIHTPFKTLKHRNKNEESENKKRLDVLPSSRRRATVVVSVSGKWDTVIDISGRDGGVLHVGENLEVLFFIGWAGHETVSAEADVVVVIMVDAWGIGESCDVCAWWNVGGVGLREANRSGGLNIEPLAAGNKDVQARGS